MVIYSSYSALGSSIEATEITDGVITVPKLNTSSFGDTWVLLETLTPSGVSTSTSSSLTAYKQYKVEIDLTPATASAYLGMRFNGDTGNNYKFNYLSSGTFTVVDNTSSIKLAVSQFINLLNHRGAFIINGVCGDNGSSGQLTMNNVSYTAHGLINTFFGGWNGGRGTQISTINLFSDQNFSGTIKIFGRNIT